MNADDIAEEHSASPVLQAIVRKGWKAAEEAEGPTAPYTRSTSGARWRTFSHAWFEGYNAFYEAGE